MSMLEYRIDRLRALLDSETDSLEKFYDTLEDIQAIVYNYHDYATTAPIDVDKELKRLPTANYELCCALITMILREDHFSEGSFDERLRNGQVRPVVKKMIELLKSKSREVEKLQAANINYIGILDYLYNNQEKAFVDPESPNISEEDKNKYQLMKQEGQEAVTELGKIARKCGEIFGLNKISVEPWLSASGTKTRKTLCVHMRYGQFMHSPISISIVVEKNGGSVARYKICLDIQRDGVEKDILEKYHTHLDLPLPNGMCYAGGTCNKWGNYDTISKSVEIIKDKVACGELRKVQPCIYIGASNIKTNEEYATEIFEAVRKIIPFYKHVIDKEDGDVEMSEMKFDKNMILYGPPGTGKTYSTAIYAVAICDELDIETVKAQRYDDVITRYRELVSEGRVAFTTFHQSYGYEEFIEGIKPVMIGDDNIGYSVEDGVFKSFCKRAGVPEGYEIDHNAKIWKVVLKSGESSDNNSVKLECFNEGKIMYDWRTKEDHLGSYQYAQIEHFCERMNIGDVVVTYLGKNSKCIDAIGIVTGDAVYDAEKSSYRWSRTVRWIDCNLELDISSLNAGKYFDNDLLQNLKRVNIVSLLKLVGPMTLVPTEKNCVFVIDEINRGNISKIFGELITLIEDTKREGMDEQASAILPYSGDKFSVPYNVYILGTMNTADRSIALMDTALRRRFQFVEMMPDANVLRAIGANKVAELDVAEMLEKINERITFLYDREHTIGHAFFTKLAKAPTIQTLASIFEKSVIPLLQEYFYEDYQKIQLVLGDNGKQDPKTKFILDEEVKAKRIFKGHAEDVVDLPEKKFTINKDAFLNIESYKQII